MRASSTSFIVISVLALAGCSSHPSAQAASGAGGGGRGRNGRGAIAVETAPAGRMDVERHADLSGTLVSPDQAKVSSEAPGIVREVPVQLGTEVRVGDTLARLDTRELALALERAESALRQVEAQLGVGKDQETTPADEDIATVRQALANRDDAKASLDRATQLGSRGLVSKVDRETAETRYKVAEANYQATLDTVRGLRAMLQDRRAAVDLATKKLNDAVIRAPVAGAVSERLIQPGEYIKEDTPVVTIVQLNPLKLRTSIQEKFAAAIAVGQVVTFQVEAFPGRAFDGKIAYVSPALDQTTRTLSIEALVDNPDRVLKPGFFAKGYVALSVDRGVISAPDDAVSTLAGVSTVYVLENGKARQQIISLGAHTNKQWEVTQGLKGDEVLAVSQLNQLATGMSVTTGGPEAGSGRGGGRGRGRGEGSAQ